MSSTATSMFGLLHFFLNWHRTTLYKITPAQI